MIISKTPFRMSFVGGGSDLASFYEKSEGAVVSVAIDKFMYIWVNKKFDQDIRISYSQTENIYEILIYFQKPGTRYDSLVGYTTVVSGQ